MNQETGEHHKSNFDDKQGNTGTGASQDGPAYADDLAAGVREIVDSVRAEAEDLNDRATKFFSDTVAPAFSVAEEEVRRHAGQARAAMGAGISEATATIKAWPWASVGIAAAAGLVLSRVILGRDRA